MEDSRLAYRVRTAEVADALALRDAIGSSLAHPDHQGRRESYRGAAARGDILVLERYDRPAHDWQLAGFVECHMRVDDNLSIRDIGTAGDEPQTGVVRYLLDQAFNSFRPAGAQVKIRRDARDWSEIFQAIPGFYLEGEEYRRPHYWAIWRWDRQHAREAERQSPSTTNQQPQRLRPRPPSPPAGGPGSGSSIPGRDTPGPPQRGPRPGGPGRDGGTRPGGPGGPVGNARPRSGGSPRRPNPAKWSP